MERGLADQNETASERDQNERDSSPIIKAMEGMLQAKDEIIKAKDEIIKGKDETLRAKDDFIRLKDDLLLKAQVDQKAKSKKSKKAKPSAETIETLAVENEKDLMIRKMQAKVVTVHERLYEI